MFKKLINRLISEELDRRAAPESKVVLPVGYNPLERIRGGFYHLVQVPFNGVSVWCELRCLNASQIEACGNISSITGEKRELSWQEIIQIRNIQENLAKAVLNKPTFDRIIKIAIIPSHT
jgi:hypothetical protein